MVETAPGRGSRFGVLLPPTGGASACRAGEAEPAPAPTPLPPARLLVVDDEASVREFLRDLLESRGFSVTTAADGQQALACLDTATAPFDLVVTDQTMPRLTGLALARTLLERGGGPPVLLCSGHAEALDEKRAREAGVARFLRKPLETPELLETIRGLLAAPGPDTRS